MRIVSVGRKFPKIITMYLQRITIYLFVFFFLPVQANTSLYASEREVRGELALPMEPCKVEPLSTWSPQEKWVWGQVCAGKIADFNEAEDYGGKLDPRKTVGWPENRVLRPEFLETILRNEPYRSSLTQKGIYFRGAWFTEPLDLSFLTLTYPLFLEYCRFEKDVNFLKLKSSQLIELHGSRFVGNLNMDSVQIESSLLMQKGEYAKVNLQSANIGSQLAINGSKFNGKLNLESISVTENLLAHEAEFVEVALVDAKIGGVLDMSSSKVTGMLNMDSLQVENHLFMSNQAESAEVVLVAAKIGGNLNMSSSKFTGKLDMNSLQVDGHLFMKNKAEFVEVVLVAAKIRGNLEMDSSKFTGKLNMRGLQVEGAFFIREKAEFAEVRLVGAKIIGEMDMGTSSFTGELNMRGLQVEGDLFMDNLMIGSEVMRLVFGKIGGNLHLEGTLPSLDLTGTQIKGELRLGSEKGKTRWQEGAKLTLRNTNVGVLPYSETENAWPSGLELDGFTYDRLVGFGPGDINNVAGRNVTGFKDWLAKQKEYSPGPYEELANMLVKAGHKGKADDILYAGRERERNQARGLNWFWLTPLKIFIGYGYRLYYSLGWVLGFIMVGAASLRLSGQGKAHGMPYGITYSIDMLLPIIELRKRHYEIDLVGWARYYFYIHKIMGYILASFIIAGLSGLTKR